MRINDALAGVLCLALAVALAAAAWNLPNPAAQPFGPGAFPILLATLLGLAASILLVRGAADTSRGPLLAFADWTGSRAKVARFALVPASVAAYVLFADAAGFVPTAAGILLALLLSGRVPLVRSALLALGGALVVHSIFYLGLGVQLPWGLLQPIRW